MKKIYPDTLDRLEFQSGRSDDHWQVYSITDGMGGPGIGDIAGRLVQELLTQCVAKLGTSDPQTFDFAEFSQKFVRAAHEKLAERLARFQKKGIGCSLAFILVNGATCYTFSVGSNRIYLVRDGRLYHLTKEHVVYGQTKPFLYLGILPAGKRAQAENLNKIILNDGDQIILASDGVYRELVDQQILQLVDGQDDFAVALRRVENYLSRQQINDDYTILSLKVLRSSGMVQPSQLQHLSDDNRSLPLTISHNKHQVTEGDPFHQSQQEKFKLERKSRFKQGLKLFGQCYGIGLSLGIILIILFWLFYIGI